MTTDFSMIHILTIILILTDVTCTTISHVGTAIFHNKRSKNECWSEDELATLRVRRVFEGAMPTNISPEKINDAYIKEMLMYFKQALGNVTTHADKHSATLLKNALADAIGAHLTREILPAARFSYYAGYVSYRKVREAHDFLDQIKTCLNTQGVGWARPENLPPWTNISVVKIFIGNGKLLNPCSGLVVRRDANSCIHLPAPKLDDNVEPSAIALPFKSGGLVSLVSPGAQNVLLKYYTTAARCILRNSPEKCRHDDFLNFNNELWHWMKRSVAPHLGEDKLYSAYGGILRIAAAVQSYGKGLSRRNLFEDEEEDGNPKWQPWKTLSDSYVYIDPDWTPSLYVLMVGLAAAAICLSQICYSLIFGKDSGCHCSRNVDHVDPEPKVQPHCAVQNICPALIPPHQSPIPYGDHDRIKFSRTSVKKSLRSMQSQKVYDLHENTEKIMAVIMSDNQMSSEAESETMSHSRKVERKFGATNAGLRDASPPEIETSISQLKIEKNPSGKRSPVYSTSTNSRSAMTFCNEHRDSGSAWSGSSTSEQSTSGSFKSRCKKSKNKRDLAWARRVASKASQVKSTSGTEIDVHSFTTPPSKHMS